ncbi:MAG: hypothetical protein ISP49_19780 [Reyranella sp.]|jgi:hypothetical protein|nr:hypothetical protein [Reyranella sp.]MBL6653845.1 hypothetical protein [Reyranella sp.]
MKRFVEGEDRRQALLPEYLDVDPVQFEPVSTANSLLAGNFAGNLDVGSGRSDDGEPAFLLTERRSSTD